MVSPAAGRELIELQTRNGLRITGVFMPGAGSPREGIVRPTILFFYGNGTCMAHNLDLLSGLQSLGFNAMMIDYPGFGMSEGGASETGCYESAGLALDYLVNRDEAGAGRIIAAGWSLGAAVAVDLAARKNVAGLAMFSAFTRMGDMVRLVARGLPLRGFLNSRFDNLAKLPKVRCPVLMVHGASDSTIPLSMLHRLAEAGGSAVKVIEVEGADHNDLFDVGGEALYQQIRAFVATIRNSRRLPKLFLNHLKPLGCWCV